MSEAGAYKLTIDMVEGIVQAIGRAVAAADRIDQGGGWRMIYGHRLSPIYANGSATDVVHPNRRASRRIGSRDASRPGPVRKVV